jgi:non-ribosomal peptide synthetase-like protein
MTLPSILLGESRPDCLREETLADIFRESSLRAPDKLALVCGDDKITYRELDTWSDNLAKELAAKGIRPGTLVGVWWPRGIELHVAILAIIKAGAGYVPIDSEMPRERVEAVLMECGAKACFSKSLLESSLELLSVPERAIASASLAPIQGGKGSDLAYILYTSGSTGKPKGIPISQAQICHLVRAEQVVLDIKADDKVYQGFSVSFDMWCEETWISYFAGATLFVADATTAKAMDELPDFLRKNQITVLHAVPSLLAVIDDDIPTLRLVNAGGEACTKAVLARWSKPGRIFFNSYGPTETTVTAAMVALKPGDAISIGKPLPNYNLAIVDDQLNLMPCGESGELIITGPGVGDGYINLPELSSQKFVEIPDKLKILPGKKLYRSGDAAIIHADGSIEFQGRFDDQVKIRGYRIELGEIESQLNQQQGILAAAVAVMKDSNGYDELVGFIVCSNGVKADEALLRKELAKVLPIYMVPGIIVSLSEMPRLPSGKINRKKLPVPESFLVSSASSVNTNESPIDPGAPVSERVIEVLKKIFPGRPIDLEMDFFNELGGHSLLAASFVSRLRKEGGIPSSSLRDVYQHRPLKALVDHWSKAVPGEQKKRKEGFRKIPAYRYINCWIAQSIALMFVFALFAGQVFFPYLGYYHIQQRTGSHAYAILAAFLLFLCIPPLFTFLGILTKWLVIGKIKEGDYPLWGSYYFRLWFVKAVQELVPIQFLNGTPVYPVYLRMLGAKVAKDAQLSAIRIGAEDLVTIGSDVSVSSQVLFNNVTVSGGMMRIRKINIGDHSYIGTSSVIAGGATMEAWAELQDQSFLQEGKVIGSGEIWSGSPAQKTASVPIEDLPKPLEVSDSQRRGHYALYTFLLAIFPFAVLLPLFPVIYIINELDNNAADYDFRYMVYMPLVTIAYQLLFILMTVVFSRLLMKNIKPGKYPVHSTVYVRKWLADQFMSLSLIVLHPVYATVYISSFFRLLGAKVGKGAEISTAASVTHPLLKIGKGAFIADAVQLGEADVRGQQLILEETHIGNNSFVGNSALIPQGYHLPDNTLIGVLSMPPKEEEISGKPGSDWFGSPAIALPKRQESQPFPPELTVSPSTLRYLARAFVELIRIVIPETVVICLSILLIAYGHDLLSEVRWWKFPFLFPLYYLGFMGVPAFLITVLLKWTFGGKHQPRQMPIWTFGVWKSEAITVIYEALSVPFLLQYLRGTPWLPFLLRLLGVKIGSRVWMNTTDITEFDMVTIGDDAALNDDCGPQTHLFEDRVMKVAKVNIGARSSIGAKSIVLYDTEVGEDVDVEALSLVMKGERLPPGTSWTGSPVRPL